MSRAGLGYPPVPPEAFQKAMFFVDGTNLFYRLASEKIVVPSILKVLAETCKPRELVRAYIYSTDEHLMNAESVHGHKFLSGCRVVRGHAIPKGDGNIKEKGVDALLVADLIYHAASRNCDIAYVVTHDTDFSYALRRVEDFGCRTAVVAIGVDAPDQLRDSCDSYIYMSKEKLFPDHLASPAP